MLSVYDTHAPRLLAMGAHPLVIAPGTKKPAYAGWTDLEKEAVTVPQPEAGIGARLGKQANGTYLVAIDWDNDEAALAALEKFPPAIMKEGARGLTMIYKSYTPVSSRDFRAKGVTVVQVLSDGRQSVLPPSIHPDTKRPYVWTSKFSLYDLPHIDDLPSLPHDYLDRIEKIIEPLGYKPEPEKPKFESDPDNLSPYHELNGLALRNIPGWVPALGLHNLRRERGRMNYTAVASWRPSNEGKPLEQRDNNLKISSKGIVDFGDGHKGYSPIDLVMTARGCARDEAIRWLQERVQGGPEVDWESIASDRQEEPQSVDTKNRRFVLTPFVPIDPLALPPRKWLYAKHYQRRIVSATIAPGGTGKSGLNMVEAIVMASGRPLLGEMPEQRCRVWLHNGEEPLEELNRKILAVCQLYNLPQEELRNYLFCTSGTEVPLKVARGYNELRLDKGLIRDMRDHMLENKIDVAIFDPLISLHGTSEMDNNRMDEVMRIFIGLAEVCGCSIEISHHTRKGSAGSAEFDRTGDDSPGATAVRDAVRGMRVLNIMSTAEAGKVGIDEVLRFSYFRVDPGKSNMTAPGRAPVWRKFESVFLPNGDDVGVVTRWEFPTDNVLDYTAAAQADDILFMQILERFTAQGRTVNASSGTTYAPAAFAKEPEALGQRVNKHRMGAAMRRLFAAKRIRVEAHEKAGQKGSRIVRT
jgi:RecA-family ATPase